MMPLHHLAPTLGGGELCLRWPRRGEICSFSSSLSRWCRGRGSTPSIVLAHGVAEEGRPYPPCLACGIAEGRFAPFSLLGVVDQGRIRTFPGHPRLEEDRSRFTLNLFPPSLEAPGVVVEEWIGLGSLSSPWVAKEGANPPLRTLAAILQGCAEGGASLLFP